MQRNSAMKKNLLFSPGVEADLPDEDGLVSADREVFEQVQLVAPDADRPERVELRLRGRGRRPLLLTGGDLRRCAHLSFLL